MQHSNLELHVASNRVILTVTPTLQVQLTCLVMFSRPMQQINKVNHTIASAKHCNSIRFLRVEVHTQTFVQSLVSKIKDQRVQRR